MNSKISFGQWLKQHRKVLGLAQGDLARQIHCATVTLHKIEADERRPSRQIAERLAEVLEIAPDKLAAFVAFARLGSDSGVGFHPSLNVPIPATPLFGRDENMQTARKQLLHSDTRLLTLIGPPGIGKTRLALQVARELCDHFEGTYFVPLAPIRDAALLLPTIGQTLKLNEANDQSWLNRLIDYLHLKRVLLVLDNFEQIISATLLISKLVVACPQLKVLVTSRIALRIRAERQFPVPPLALPDLNRLPTANTLINYSAIAMFLDRAQTVAPDFQITEGNAATVAQICHRLDGLPLALELIATRTQILDPHVLLERLNGQLLLHSDGLQDVDDRQHTLMSAIQWSYDLLTLGEQRLFRYIGVFVDGWTFEALEQICLENDLDIQGLRLTESSGNPSRSWLLDMMTSLVNKSMVVRQTGDGEIRFALLETIREYSLGQLETQEEITTLKRHHARYFLALAQEASHHFHHVGESHWLKRLDREKGNLRAAMGWAFLAHESQLLAQLALAFADMAWMSNLMNEARDWIERALSLFGELHQSSLTYAYLLNAVGMNAFLRGDYLSAEGYHERALTVAKTLKSETETAYSLFALALAAYNAGHRSRGEALWLEALPLAQQTDNHWLEGMILANLSEIERGQGNEERAIQLCEDGIRLLRSTGDALFTTMLLNNLGAITRQQGRYAEAMAIHLDCLRTTFAIGNVREVAHSLEKLAGAMAALGDGIRAIRLLGAASIFRLHISAPVEASYQYDYDDILANTRRLVTKEQFDAAWGEGRAMSLDEVAIYALSSDL